MSFKELGLSDPVLRSLKDLDHSDPSEIQTQAIPIILEERILWLPLRQELVKQAVLYCL